MLLVFSVERWLIIFMHKVFDFFFKYSKHFHLPFVPSTPPLSCKFCAETILAGKKNAEKEKGMIPVHLALT